MKLHEFTVSGNFPFPLDMLRYDSCWPHSGDDVAEIESSLSREQRRLFQIRLVGINKPTLDRWSSFCWTCKEGHLMTTDR